MADRSPAPRLVSDVQLQARVLIHNNTVSELHLSNHIFWAGGGTPTEQIPPRHTAEFTVTGDSNGPRGAVMYGFKNGHQYTFSFHNPGKQNKAYAEILNPGEQINWDHIKSKLDRADNKSVYSKATATATVVIDRDGASPTLMAILE